MLNSESPWFSLSLKFNYNIPTRGPVGAVAKQQVIIVTVEDIICIRQLGVS